MSECPVAPQIESRISAIQVSISMIEKRLDSLGEEIAELQKSFWAGSPVLEERVGRIEKDSGIMSSKMNGIVSELANIKSRWTILFGIWMVLAPVLSGILTVLILRSGIIGVQN